MIVRYEVQRSRSSVEATTSRTPRKGRARSPRRRRFASTPARSASRTAKAGRGIAGGSGAGAGMCRPCRGECAPGGPQPDPGRTRAAPPRGRSSRAPIEAPVSVAPALPDPTKSDASRKEGSGRRQFRSLVGPATRPKLTPQEGGSGGGVADALEGVDDEIPEAALVEPQRHLGGAVLGGGAPQVGDRHAER